MPARRNPLVVNLLLLAASLTATLAVVEVAARRALRIEGEASPSPALRVADDPGIGFELIPGFDANLGYINSRGFRGPEVAVPKPPGVYRIVMIGDSQTIGGAGEGNSIPSRLEKMLNDDPAVAARRRVEVVNAGVYSYNIPQVYHALVRKIPPLEPDLVIYNFYGNDLSNVRYAPFTDGNGRQQLMVYHYTSVGQEGSGVLPAFVDRLLSRHLVSYAYAMHVLRFVLQHTDTRGIGDIPDDERANLHYFDDILAAVARMGAGFLLVTIPRAGNAVDCDKSETDYARSESMAAYARARSVHVLKLDRAFYGSDLPVAHADSVHFTRLGHERLAAEIKAALVPYLLR